MDTDTVILGIDPGTNLLGYSVLAIHGGKPEIVTLGVIDLRKVSDPYLKLARIHERINGIVTSFKPQELAIEAPFCGVNVQSMIKLGRAQGVCIAAAMAHDMTVHEYAPTKVKMALTGNGDASKEQVAGMLQKIFKMGEQAFIPYLDATDALAVAYCHFTHRRTLNTGKSYSGWADFVRQNTGRVAGQGALRTAAAQRCGKASDWTQFLKNNQTRVGVVRRPAGQKRETTEHGGQ